MQKKDSNNHVQEERLTQKTHRQDKEFKHKTYSELGKKGGKARAEQLGHEGYVELGQKGGKKRKEQMLAQEKEHHKNKSS